MPIREFWDHLVTNYRTKYKPGFYITIDKQLLEFRGEISISDVYSKQAHEIWNNNCHGMTTIKYMLNRIPYVDKKNQTVK